VSPAAAESPMQALLASLGALDSLKSFSIQGVAEKTLDGFYEKAKQITGKDTYEFGDLSRKLLDTVQQATAAAAQEAEKRAGEVASAANSSPSNDPAVHLGFLRCGIPVAVIEQSNGQEVRAFPFRSQLLCISSVGRLQGLLVSPRPAS